MNEDQRSKAIAMVQQHKGQLFSLRALLLEIERPSGITRQLGYDVEETLTSLSRLEVNLAASANSAMSLPE